MGSPNAATPQPPRALHGVARGEPAWMVLAGEFASRDAALQALRRLPAASLRTAGTMRTAVLPTGQ